MRMHIKIHRYRSSKNDILRYFFRFLTIALILSFSIDGFSTSTTIRLFNENGKIVQDYNKQVQRIIQAAKNNSLPISIQFSHGLSFNVYSVFHGNQNLILDIGDQILRLRLSKYTPLRFWNGLLNPAALIDSLNNYVSGYTKLKENGIPVPELKILPDHKKEFLMIEKVNIEFSYRDYLDTDFIKTLSPKNLFQIDNDFLIFVRKTAQYRNLGDFNSNQLVYTKNKGWVLIDFSNNHEMIQEGSIGGNVFEFDRYDKLSNLDAINSHFVREIIQKPGLPDHIKEKALQIIENERHRPILQCHQLFKL